jgi:hypothetical protein
MERCLQGSCSKERRLLVKLALVTASQMKVFQNDELNHLKGLLAKLDGICELQRNIRAASDCSFLYWHRVVLPIYFARLIEERADLRRLKVNKKDKSANYNYFYPFFNFTVHVFRFERLFSCHDFVGAFG